MLRMLQVPELKRAMGFDDRFRVEYGTRRDRIRLLGNGVCPPVMEAVVLSLAQELPRDSGLTENEPAAPCSPGIVRDRLYEEFHAS
jgi:hypothetical protein